MKPVYSPEVAQELGYQKFSPELKDWIIATLGCLGALATFGLVLVLVIHLVS